MSDFWNVMLIDFRQLSNHYAYCMHVPPYNFLDEEGFAIVKSACSSINIFYGTGMLFDDPKEGSVNIFCGKTRLFRQ